MCILSLYLKLYQDGDEIVIWLFCVTLLLSSFLENSLVRQTNKMEIRHYQHCFPRITIRALIIIGRNGDVNKFHGAHMAEYYEC